MEELLDEDDLIQECKSLNTRLNAFLSKRESVELLVEYLVQEPPEDAEPKRAYKFPFASCEIFCCEVEAIFNALLEDDDLMDKLFSILDTEEPPNVMLAGYFSRVTGALLLRRTADISGYIQRKPELLQQMVKHVDTTSIAEVIVRLAGADDQRAFMPTTALDWLADTQLLNLLSEALGHESPPEAQANAAEILAAIARSPASPLTTSLASSDFLDGLVCRALEPSDQGALTHALNLCIALLEPVHSLTEAHHHHQYGGGDPVSQDILDLQMQLRHGAVRCVAKSVNRLVAMLDDKKNLEMRTSYGVIKQPVGQSRLKAVELLAALLRAGEEEAEVAVIESNGVQRCMELFIAYPFNNVLHNSCVQLFIAFDGGSEQVVRYLLAECNLPKWLAEAPEATTPISFTKDDTTATINDDEEESDTGTKDDDTANENGKGTPPTPSKTPTPSAASASKKKGKKKDKKEKKKKQRSSLRAGYLGHISQLGSKLHEVAAHSDLVKEILDNCKEWSQFYTKTLEPRLAESNIFTWKCGRPGIGGMVMGGNGEGDDLQSATGGGGGGNVMHHVNSAELDSSSFRNAVYQRYSAFDDEDEDDDEDEEEEEGGEGSGEEEGGEEGEGKVGGLPTKKQQGKEEEREEAFGDGSQIKEDSASDDDDDDDNQMGSWQSATSTGSPKPSPFDSNEEEDSNSNKEEGEGEEGAVVVSDELADLDSDAVLMADDEEEEEVAEQLLELQDQFSSGLKITSEGGEKDKVVVVNGDESSPPSTK